MFLEEHPEEKMNLPTVDERLRSKNYPIGAKVISAFLNWPESRVSYSLERLRLIEDNKIDKQAIESLPTERSARDFVKAVREMDLPLHKQKAPCPYRGHLRYAEAGHTLRVPVI